jgi:hypothetical protein
MSPNVHLEEAHGEREDGKRSEDPDGLREPTAHPAYCYCLETLAEQAATSWQI